jgi:hypothetical protein
MADGSAAGVPHEHYMFYGHGVHVEIDNFQRVGLYKGIPFKYERTTHYAPAGFDHGVLVWEPQNNLATLENKALFTQGIYAEMRYFCDCILEQRPAELCGLPFALELMKVHEAALLSERDRIAVTGWNAGE